MIAELAKDYVIVSETTDWHLVKAVKERMKSGWQPIGGPFVWPGIDDGAPVLSQAMILPSK